MPGPMRGRMPGEKKVENPGRIFKRLMKYVMKSYGLHLVIVAVLILVSVLANVQGTMFIQSLIDDYIQPLLTAESADYQPLAMAILRVAGFYAIGVASAYIYNRLMINVTQGVLRNLRNDLFSHMETPMGISCPSIPTIRIPSGRWSARVCRRCSTVRSPLSVSLSAWSS